MILECARHLWRYSFLALAFAAALPTYSAVARDNSDGAASATMLILDGSGSMWGKMDGTSKIAVARKVVAELLEDWDPDMPLGLMSYGHRRKGACDDIETLVPVQPNSAARITRKVKALQPKGKTPLSAALREAAKQLRIREEPATVVLVTDGLETCDADPCAVAAALEKTGIDFTAHVIGFDVRADERDRIACIARATGGKFLSAANAAELKSALATAVEETRKAVPDTVVATLAEGGDPLTDYDLQWRVWPKRARGTESGEPVLKRLDPVLRLSGLEPGSYRVEAAAGETRRAIIVTLKDGDDPVRHVINLDAGMLRFEAIRNKGGKVIKDYIDWTVYPATAAAKDKKALAHLGLRGPAPFILPAGKYQIEARMASLRKRIVFGVEAGQREQRTINLEAGEIKLQALHAPAGPKARAYLDWDVYPVDADGAVAKKSIAHYGVSKPVRFVLAAGDYLIRARGGARGVTAEKRVTLVAGKTIADKLVLNTADVKLIAVDGSGTPLPGRLRYTLHAIHDGRVDKRRTISLSGRGGRGFTVPAGSYEVRVSGGDKDFVARIDLAAGQTGKIRIALPTN